MSDSRGTESTRLWLMMPNRRLRRIPVQMIPARVKVLDFSENPITTISEIPSLPHLEKLTCRDTNISTFAGVREQPSLYSLDMRDSPISSYKFFNAMASIVFGRSLTIINGTFISSSDETVRDSIGPMIRSKLTRGLILVETNPVTLYDPQADKEMVINLPEGKSLLTKSRKSPEFDEDALIEAVQDHIDPYLVEQPEEKPEKFSEMVLKYQKHEQAYQSLRARIPRTNIVFAKGEILKRK